MREGDKETGCSPGSCGRHEPGERQAAGQAPADSCDAGSGHASLDTGLFIQLIILEECSIPLPGQRGLKLERLWALQAQPEHPLCTWMTCSVGFELPKRTRHCKCTSAASSPLLQAQG